MLLLLFACIVMCNCSCLRLICKMMVICIGWCLYAVFCILGCSFSNSWKTQGGWLLLRAVSNSTWNFVVSIEILWCWLSLMCNFSFYRSKVHTYDDVVEKVAQRIGLDDPSKIRLTAHNCYSQQPKPQPIKYRGVDHLSDMLVHYNQVVFSLF